MRFIICALLGALVGPCWPLLLSAAPTVAATIEDETVPRPPASLRAFVEAIAAAHPAILRAEAELKAARARARGQRRPIYNPEFELAYDNALDNARTAGVTQTLDLAGKRGARAGVASAEVRAAEARLALVRKALLAEILAALSEYHSRRAFLRIAESRVRLDGEFLDLARRRHETGELPQSELLTARLILAQAQAERSAAGVAFSRAEERLAALLGTMPKEVPPLEGVPPSPRAVSAGEIAMLPELRLAEANQEAARARIRLAKRRRVPDPTFGLSVGRERGGFDPLGRRERTTSFGVRLSIPLFVRNGFRAEVEAAGEEFVAAERSYQERRRRVEARLAASLARYRTAFGAWQDWLRQGRTPLEKQRTLLRRLFVAGEIGAIDYTVQLNQTFATERAGVNLRGRLWASWFDWLDASGTISQWMENLR